MTSVDSETAVASNSPLLSLSPTEIEIILGWAAFALDHFEHYGTMFEDEQVLVEKLNDCWWSHA